MSMFKNLFRKETHFVIAYAYDINVKQDVIGRVLIELDKSSYPNREMIEACIKNDEPGARKIKILSVDGFTKEEYEKLFT